MLATHSHRYLRKQPLQARSRRTVESILEAADRVLRREGYGPASTNRIAQVAGYSVGSLYQYFADKESVVRTLIDRSLQAEDELLGERLEQAVGEPLEVAVGDLLETQLRGRWAEAHVATALLEEGSHLYAQPPLERVQSLQTAIASRLQQVAVAHWNRLRLDDTAAMLWTFCTGANAISLGFAAVSPSDIALDDLAAVLREGFASALISPPSTFALAEELVAGWRSEGGTRPIVDRLPGLRSRLLGGDSPVDPARMAPAAFALACLPALLALPADARPGVSDAALDCELAVFSTALLRAAETRT